MKKFLIILCSCLCLAGCHKPKYHLYFFYASSCPVCKSFRNNVIPELEDKYGSDMKITQLDIDAESSMDQYALFCSELKGYRYNDNSGNVPFIVLDGYFARVGYEIGGEEIMLTMIDDAINEKDLEDIEAYEDIEYYMFEEE